MKTSQTCDFAQIINWLSHEEGKEINKITIGQIGGTWDRDNTCILWNYGQDTFENAYTLFEKPSDLPYGLEIFIGNMWFGIDCSRKDGDKYFLDGSALKSVLSKLVLT